METFLFFSRQINLIKGIKTSNNEYYRNLSKYSTNIGDKHDRNIKKKILQKYISTDFKVNPQVKSWSKIASHKCNEKSMESIYSNTPHYTFISPTPSNSQNIPYILDTDFWTDAIPFNIIYNIPETSCWIITIIHSIRANPALKAYILNNLNSEEIEKALKSVLEIDKWYMSRHLHYLITYLYGYGEDLWNKLGYETLFLESLLKGLDYTKTQRGILPTNSGISYRKRVNIKKENNYTIRRIAGLPYLPYFYIYPSSFSPNTQYFSISNVFQSDYYNSTKITTKSQGVETLDCSFDFLVFNLEELHNFTNKSSIVKGITIEKDIYINNRGMERKQKYYLTGISFREYKRGYAHSRAVIKINNMWYDTDYETLKYQNKNTQGYYKLPERLDTALNMNDNEITLTYLPYEDTYHFVCLLFYEKVDTNTNQE